jgi:hypothetical protein
MDDYRSGAADALNLARRVANAPAKERLLCLAENWLALADRAAGRASVCDHNRLNPATAERHYLR